MAKETKKAPLIMKQQKKVYSKPTAQVEKAGVVVSFST